MKYGEMLVKTAEQEKVAVESLVPSWVSWTGIPCPTTDETLYPCPRFRFVVTQAVCRQCKSDGAFRDSLFQRYVRNRAARAMPCVHRGRLRDTVSYPCCGGDRRAFMGLYPCQITGRMIADPDCWLCDEYEPPSASEETTP